MSSGRKSENGKVKTVIFAHCSVHFALFFCRLVRELQMLAKVKTETAFFALFSYSALAYSQN
jgi:hypothetical protein